MSGATDPEDVCITIGPEQMTYPIRFGSRIVIQE
jgi:hypothetical protein